MYEVKQGLICRDGEPLTEHQINRGNVKENLYIINTFGNGGKWKRPAKQMEEERLIDKNFYLKEIISASKGINMVDKVYRAARYLIQRGIKVYLKGEQVIFSAIFTEKMKIPYSHKGSVPKAVREKS